MEWDHIREKLGHLLQAPVKRGTVSVKEWPGIPPVQSDSSECVRSMAKDGVVYFYLGTAGADKLDVLIVEEALMTSSEKKLVELLLEASDLCGKPAAPEPPAGEDERRALQVRDWLFHMLEKGDTRADMPEHLATQLDLFEPKIPFLLYGDYSDNRSVTYQDLMKLLQSFFGSDIVLIPLLEKEWLILGDESLLAASREEEQEGEEPEGTEEALTSLCGGLYEMLEHEWVGECHLTIQDPMIPAKSLPSAVQHMRETIMLGKRFNLGSNLHFPWRMHMEKLLYSVPDGEKTLFVEQVLKGIDHVLDAETLNTLEHFFSLDCNVSETAKKLYIHRNTLLYRLDRFKQETGKDVRSFNDAVLVKTAILLYKVTKRK